MPIGGPTPTPIDNTAGNIDRRKYERLVELGWLMATSPNVSDVLYEVTDKGRQDAS